METVSDACPTGILVDIDLQSKGFSNVNQENEKNQTLNKNKNEKVSATDTKSSHKWASNCFLDTSPPRTPSISQMNVFFTPKSNLKTPSPKSMKIISREASRIVDRLYSSPINCSEVMIYDEIFPTEKSFEDALDEFHFKSKSLPAIDVTFAQEKVDQRNADSLDLTKCTVSAVSSCPSKDLVSEETSSKLVLQSEIKPTVEPYSMSKEKEYDQKPHTGFHLSDKKDNAVIFDPISECVNMSSDKFLEHEDGVTIHKKISKFAKGLGLKIPLGQSEKNKENILANGTRQPKCGPEFVKAEKNCNSVEYCQKEEKMRKKQILRNRSMMKIFSKSNISPKPLALGKKEEENRNLEDNFSKKPKAVRQKSDVVSSKSLLFKKDPLCKTAELFGTPVVASSVHDIRSFPAGRSSCAFPERKFISTANSCSRVLKPKMPLNQVSVKGSRLSTPIQYRKFEPAGSSAAKTIQRKCLVLNSSLVANDIKLASQNDQHSSVKKPVTTSSRFGFAKKLNMPSSVPKSKNDNLPRKLFP